MFARNCWMLQQRGKYPYCKIVGAKCYGLFQISANQHINFLLQREFLQTPKMNEVRIHEG
jgi:hypothetical protein